MDFGFISKFVGFFKPGSLKLDDDYADRLSHHVTCGLLMLFTVLVSGKTYVGKPLQCAVPHQFNKAMEQYAENYCFVQNTYFVGAGEEIPVYHRDRENREITYYQWVPFVLALQALMFYFPCIVWRALNWKSGLQVSTIADLATKAQTANTDDRKAAVTSIVAHLHEGLHSQKERKKTFAAKLRQTLANYCCLVIGRKYGNYLTSLYLFVKSLYVINVIGQFFLMNAFLSSSWTSFYGIELLEDLSTGHEWHLSGQFPRVTFCDFEMRVLGNVQRYTIQCVLMINMFNEKIYIFLWWWCIVVAVVSVFSFFKYLIKSTMMSQRNKEVLSFLKMNKKSRDLRRNDVANFTKSYLQKDGVLMISLIAANAGGTVAYDVIEALWERYQADDQTNSSNRPSTMGRKSLDDYTTGKPELKLEN